MLERIEDGDGEMGEVTFIACSHGETVKVSSGCNHRVLREGIRMTMDQAGVFAKAAPIHGKNLVGGLDLIESSSNHARTPPCGLGFRNSDTMFVSRR